MIIAVFNRALFSVTPSLTVGRRFLPACSSSPSSSSSSSSSSSGRFVALPPPPSDPETGAPPAGRTPDGAAMEPSAGASENDRR